MKSINDGQDNSFPWLGSCLTSIIHSVCSLPYDRSTASSKASSPRKCYLKRVKVKESCNMLGVAQRVPGGLGSQIPWHSARKGGEVVSLTHRPPLLPGVFLVHIFTNGWVEPRATVRSEADTSLKHPVTPPGIDPGTVRLVAQRLNHYATPGPTECYLASQYCSGDQIEKNETRGASSAYGEEVRCIQGFGGETWGKENTWKTKAQMGG
jgi:hypothetical protein